MTRYNSIRSGGECYGCIEERRGLYNRRYLCFAKRREGGID